ncbi:hypothetical protein N4G70_17160 [Streptomyces sp. ASQP_92]|uniref:hypothetical protein n=1 Tax=Streptomyces sp. ASQP_92 TaxID=2979116 RepID=UPI0021BF1FA8|nr:hypothetical protein [Streptomyces sp. ASQP_92]MCT9090571.1 hypothetical protein [Streptomyces sp. ASQP_92]
MSTTSIVTEHPAWHETPEGVVRVVEHNGVAWVAHWQGDALLLRSVGTTDVELPPVAYVSPINLPHHTEAQPLVRELARLGTVQRLTNPSLWDAITTALLRQVVRARTAKERHRAYYAAYGRSVETIAGPLALAPTPETVLALNDEQFATIGAAFNRTALRSAARAYLDRGEHWSTLDADRLVKELVEVPYIGPWTAAAATADYTGDHAVYPHGDLAVRTWAGRAAPSLQLPSRENEFAAMWRRWAPNRSALHTLTLLTLAYGSHTP